MNQVIAVVLAEELHRIGDQDALVQIASLCFKSGNAVILKGGKEAEHSNRALFAVIASVLDWASERGIGFSHLVSLGDMADIDFGDMLDWLAADADTRARMAATMLSNINALVRSTTVRDIKELNLIPPLLFVKKEPRMLDDYRIFRWWQGK